VASRTSDPRRTSTPTHHRLADSHLPGYTLNCEEPLNRAKGSHPQVRHALAGAWSRRIDEEHRLVYLVDADIVILQARYHYR